MVRCVALTTLGCKVNQFETEVIEGLFSRSGYEIVPFESQADVYVINTCSVTHLGEKKSRQLIRRAIRSNPHAVIVVTGCYAQISPDAVQSIPGVDVIVGTQDRQRIVELVEQAAHAQEQVNAVTNIMNASTFEDIPLLHAPGRTRAFLKIQEGCTNFCTYCIIPYTRGPLRSRSLSSIKNEVLNMVQAGFKEIVLTGIHLGAYGQDMDEAITLTDAIETVLVVDGVRRVRLGSLESIEVSDKLLDIMVKNQRVCPHLHLPLQAGSDSILERMNRHYTTSQYKMLLDGIRCKMPHVAISTDIIVGFPGETEELFEETLAFVSTMDFAKVHVFPYSRREGTPAAGFSGQVREEEKKQRVKQIQQLTEHMKQEWTCRHIGQKADVLFETIADGVLEGLTSNYIRVYVAGHAHLLGQMKQVVLGRPYKEGLWGESLD